MKTRRDFCKTVGSALWAGAMVPSSAPASEESVSGRRPNVVLVITDDQGYGDIGAHGNTMIQTPHLDRLHGESVRFTNFHVDPTCSPSRAALMTGRYSSRTGVWHTVMGRSILHRDEVTMADLFARGGYRTGMFGKWHLGDNYPYRPEHRGFQKVAAHGGGGVGQTPDYWGNDYFDDTYWRNGEPVSYEGYCTGVFFDEALRFIEENRDERFFAYVSTNAPHSPFLVPEKYSEPYKRQGAPSPMAEFYGMITNIDENVGRLRKRLEELGIDDNTILIFMTDNGTSAGVLRDGGGEGWRGFNDGMRGQKGSEYEGGHRVPLFVHWPAGGLGEPRDAGALTAHIDLLPTLAEFCGLEKPAGADWDGVSLAPALRSQDDGPERTLFVHSQRIEHPEKWRKCAVMTSRWRLVNGEELYDLREDPGQQNDVAKQHPEVVARLRGEYEEWWEHIPERFDEQVHLVIGAEEENPARITCHDWHNPDISQIPWNQKLVRENPRANGYWAVEIEREGTYEFDLYQWDKPAGYAVQAERARLKIGETEVEAAAPEGASHVTLRTPLQAGKTRMQTWFLEGDEPLRGAFYIYARRVGPA